MTLILVGSLLLFLSVFAIWVKRQALETETWVETSTDLLENHEIRTAVSDFLVIALYDNIDVAGELERRLPPQVEPLAGPVAGALRQVAGEVADTALAEPAVQGLWEEANRTAHLELLAMIEERTGAVSTEEGTVTLDLTTILENVTDRLGVGEGLSARLPADAAHIEVMHSDELEAAQTGARALRAAAWVLAGLTLAAFALAIYLARGARLRTLRAVGFAFLAVGALVLIAHRVGGGAVVDALSEAATADAAVDRTWTIGTSQLTEIAEALVLYGILVLLGCWVAGTSVTATSVRRALTPWLREPRYAYLAVAVLLVGLFWWDPTEGTHRLAPSLLLIALALAGTEALRRQVVGEFPDRVLGSTPGGIAHALATQMREARERRVATVRQPDADSHLVELERLVRLRDAGGLTEAEYESEKKRLMAPGTG